MAGVSPAEIDAAEDGCRHRKSLTESPCALLRSVLRVETKSQRRARLDAVTSTIRRPHARRLRLRLTQTACVRRNKSCRKSSNAGRAVALELATDRLDSNRPASRSRPDRHFRFEIGSSLRPTGSPVNAPPGQALLDPQKNRAARRQASALFRPTDWQSPVARSFPWRIGARLRAPRRRLQES